MYFDVRTYVCIYVHIHKYTDIYIFLFTCNLLSFLNLTGSCFFCTTQALCDAVFCQGGGGGKRWRSAASGLVMVFQVGRSVHIAADAIHTYATEVHPEYKQQVPADMLELIHFLDEDLGHWLLFIPYYSLLALLTYCHAGAANAVHALCCCPFACPLLLPLSRKQRSFWHINTKFRK